MFHDVGLTLIWWSDSFYFALDQIFELGSMHESMLDSINQYAKMSNWVIKVVFSIRSKNKFLQREATT